MKKNTMDFDRLFETLSMIRPMSEELKTSLIKEVTHLSLPKGYVLLEAPRISEHIYFLNTGFAISYTYKKGKKQIGCFWDAGSTIFSSRSFFDQVPSDEFIELVQQSEVLCISHRSITRLFHDFSEARFIQCAIMNRYVEHWRKRALEFQRLSALKRFKKLLIVFPKIEQIVSQENIASYLGITPQSLSRMKRQNRRS